MEIKISTDLFCHVIWHVWPCNTCQVISSKVATRKYLGKVLFYRLCFIEFIEFIELSVILTENYVICNDFFFWNVVYNTVLCGDVEASVPPYTCLLFFSLKITVFFFYKKQCNYNWYSYKDSQGFKT